MYNSSIMFEKNSQTEFPGVDFEAIKGISIYSQARAARDLFIRQIQPYGDQISDEVIALETDRIRKLGMELGYPYEGTGDLFSALAEYFIFEDSRLDFYVYNYLLIYGDALGPSNTSDYTRLYPETGNEDEVDVSVANFLVSGLTMFYDSARGNTQSYGIRRLATIGVIQKTMIDALGGLENCRFNENILLVPEPCRPGALD